MTRRKRILFCSEATFLNTGYATYTREIMNELQKTGKYELAEMASYGQRNDPRAANIPWKYYGVMPNTECHPQASKEEIDSYHSNGANQFGGWIFEHVCLDFLPDIVCDIRDFWMCLTPNTNIITIDGVKKVKDIIEGDHVLTHEGRYKKVLNKFEREYFGDLHTINVMNCPFDVTLTDDHPVYCLKRNGEVNLPVSKFNKENLEWIDSQKVEKNDILVYPIDKEGDIDLDTGFCRMLGYYMAEGCIMYEGQKELNNPKGVQLTFNSSETEMITDFTNQIYINFKKAPKVKTVGNTTIVRCYSKEIAETFVGYCGSLAGDKKMSPELFHSSNDSIRSFLCGLFRGDGGYYSDRASYCTKSEQLAHQVFRLCLRLGILPSFNLNKNKIDGIDKDYYRYIFSFRSTSFDGFKVIYDNELNICIKPAKRIKNGYAWLTVKNVTTETYGETVHNFEVEEDNTYVSSFCIHNCDFAERSPFRPYFKWALMPTVDARPQARQWIATYAGADACFTYSDWAGTVLQDQAGDKINYLGSAPPSAHPAYAPVEDKRAHKEKMGIDPDAKIIGTVMRNQRRKLYPDLFKAFSQFLQERKESGDKTVYYLYCHTSYPDLGWEIPELILENEISSNVMFTYICGQTGKPFCSVYKGAVCQSKYTGEWGSTLSNVKNGVSYEGLSDIINCFDLYTQYANCEGFGLPQVEAAACGVPVCGTDYSAMESVLRKLGGYPIKPAALYKELETGCLRAVPDNKAASETFHQFFDLTDKQQATAGAVCRENFDRYYQWDKSAKQWENYFDSVEIDEGAWAQEPKLHQPQPKPPAETVNTIAYNNQARWLLANVLGESDKAGTFFESRLTRDLMLKSATGSTGGMYFNESSAAFDGNQMRAEFNFDVAYDQMKNLCERRNHWEQKRVQRIQQLGQQNNANQEN